MKKFAITLSLIGLLAGPVTGLKANLNEEDLQKMSRHKMEDRSLQNSQDALQEGYISLGALTFFGAIATGVSIYAGEFNVAILSGVATVAGGALTALTRSAWKKAVKKRMELYGEKDFWAFVRKDRGSRRPHVSYYYSPQQHHHHGHGHRARGW